MHCRPLVFVGAVLVLGLVHRSAPGATFSGPGGPIPDAASLSGPPGVVTSDVVVPDAISVQAIQVTVDDLVHTWCGDITITLTHLDTGATLALVTRIGLPLNPPPNTFGDSSNYGGVYRFADPFTLNIWTAAAAGGTSYVIPPDDYFATAAGTGFPISMLGVFGGTNAAGTWRLTITDDAAGDIGSFAGWTLEITGGEAMPCPSTGSCFIAHGSAGCDDAACCTIVCDGDASCCQTQWDADCVAAAFASCGGCGEPAAGDCCTAHATTGCADGACCAAVCSIDTFCCESQWDRGCVAEAIDLPACGCEPPLPCPAAGSCYAAHANTGCDNAACCTLVCGIDPHCCQSGWDAACANEALATCAGCGNAASGDCCSAHVGTGCDQLDCCSAVCAIDVTCCDVGWDASCADLAFTLPPCGCVLPPACGDAGTGDCCAVHANPFCDDATCCDAACAVDPFCCQSQWDARA
ncbi:MAG: proprotein convertase P-domain-containing protein [Phycisphaerales bacterium]